jgi:hypothetical protein
MSRGQGRAIGLKASPSLTARAESVPDQVPGARVPEFDDALRRHPRPAVCHRAEGQPVDPLPCLRRLSPRRLRVPAVPARPAPGDRQFVGRMSSRRSVRRAEQSRRSAGLRTIGALATSRPAGFVHFRGAVPRRKRSTTRGNQSRRAGTPRQQSLAWVAQQAVRLDGPQTLHHPRRGPPCRVLCQQSHDQVGKPGDSD